MLKCPECGKPETHRYHGDNIVVVVFECAFSATFDEGLTDEMMQRKLDEFKTSGKMLEWLKRPFP